jgi:transketolase
MKMLPGMTVINTCDFNQTKQATLAISDYDGPVYLRFGRPKVPNFIPEDYNFEIGKGILLKEGNDVTIIATGHLVWKSLEAAYELENMGVSAEVINIHTIKPLDDHIILQSVKKTGCVVTAEEHEINGGLGDSVAQLMARTIPTPMEFIAVMDKFGQSGKPESLMKHYGLDTINIIEKSKKVISRK